MERMSDGMIKVSMEDYMALIWEIPDFRKEIRKGMRLNYEEIKIYQIYVRKLQWLGGIVKPDLKYSVLHLSKRTKVWILQDLKSIIL